MQLLNSENIMNHNVGASFFFFFHSPFFHCFIFSFFPLKSFFPTLLNFNLSMSALYRFQTLPSSSFLPSFSLALFNGDAGYKLGKFLNLQIHLWHEGELLHMHFGHQNQTRFYTSALRFDSGRQFLISIPLFKK
jgi:hypothetical protein